MNVGSYDVVLTLTDADNYKWSDSDAAAKTLSFAITAKSVAATVELSQDSYTYDGTAKEPSVTVKDGETVIDSSEYTVTYTNNTNAGTATVTVTDKTGGNYTVSGSTTFTINKAALTITADNASKIYDGTALTKSTYTSEGLAASDTITSVTVTGSQTAIGSSANVPSAAVIKCGDVVVTDSYTITYVNGTLEVTNKIVNDPTIELSQSTYTYDGTAKTPTVTVKDGSTVIDPSEYTVSYINNINAGTATVTITDKDGGNYTVSGITTFTINKAALTITADSDSKTYDGTALTKSTYTSDDHERHRGRQPDDSRQQRQHPKCSGHQEREWQRR